MAVHYSDYGVYEMHLAEKPETSHSYLAGLRLVREKECAHLTGLSRQERYNLEKTGVFPPRVPIVPGSRHHGWPAGAIERWLEARAKEGAALAAEKSEGAENYAAA